MPVVVSTGMIYAAAAVAEIVGCFAFWVWLRQDKSILWLAEGQKPDIWDLAGGLIAVFGACVILFAPRPA